MKVFVAGGTGVIGRHAVPALVAAGHEVTALSRSTEKDAQVQRAGAHPIRVDLFDPDALARAVDGNDAVVNLTTHIPDLSRAARRTAWTENDRIRTEGSSNLAAAAVRAEATRFVQESITFPYADNGAAWIDEDHPRPSSPITASVDRAEASAASVTAAVVLRFGQFYAPDASHTQAFAALVRKRLNPFVGPPDAHISFIGMPAAARAVVAALTAVPGVYNIVDDDPPTRREAGETVAAALGKRRPLSLPMAVVKPVNPSAELLARSQRVDNRRYRAATGWEPDHAGAAGPAQAVAEVV